MKNYDTAAAVACLGGVFLDILKGGDIGLSGFEREAVLVGHMTIAAAAALALESYDDELCASLPAGSRIHGRRPRTLATTFGDLAFARRVCVDRYGTTFDISWVKFDCLDPSMVISLEDLKNILAEVVQDFRKRGRCYAIFERKSGCLHITVR